MNVTVFGASGKTGQVVVERALSLGYKVTAYVRRADSITVKDSSLKLIIGNLDDEAKLTEAVKGADACISTLGGSSLKKHAVEITNGIDRIVTQMEKEGVSRLIYLSSIGAGESRFYMSVIVRFIVVGLMLKIPIADHNLNEHRIEKSGLQWTIIRPGGLSNDPYTGKYKYGSEKTMLKGNPKISRANVAAFMLDQLTDSSQGKKAVWLHE